MSSIENLEKNEHLYNDLSNYKKLIKNENDSKKSLFANEIVNMGENYIQEINLKEQFKEKERLKMISYLVSKDKLKHSELNNMSFDEVKSFYIKLKKPWYKLFIEYIMGW